MVAHRIIIVGDKGVGKTCLAMRALGDTEFPTVHYLLHQGETDWIPASMDPDYIHVSCFNILVELFIVDVHASDVCGDRLRRLFYPKTCTAVICYSVEDPSSLESVESVWKPELSHYIPEASIILVGTKCDLNSRQVSTEEGRKVAANINAFHFVECSSKADQGVQNLVYEMARSVVTREHNHLYPKQRRGCSGVCIVA